MDFQKSFEKIFQFNEDTLNRELMKFTLSLYNNSLLSRKAVNSLINDIDNLISNVIITSIQHEMLIKLKPVTNDDTYHKVQFILHNNKHFFRKFSTEHERFLNYTEKSYYVQPELFEIGQNAVYVHDD